VYVKVGMNGQYPPVPADTFVDPEGLVPSLRELPMAVDVHVERR
jgi:hypothetical protein